MKLYVSIAITVLNADNQTSYGSHTGKVSTCFLIGIQCIIFLSRNKLMVKIQCNFYAFFQLSCGHKHVKQQVVHLVGVIIRIDDSGITCIFRVFTGERLQCSTDCVRTCNPWIRTQLQIASQICGNILYMVTTTEVDGVDIAKHLTKLVAYSRGGS